LKYNKRKVLKANLYNNVETVRTPEKCWKYPSSAVPTRRR